MTTGLNLRQLPHFLHQVTVPATINKEMAGTDLSKKCVFLVEPILVLAHLSFLSVEPALRIG